MDSDARHAGDPNADPGNIQSFMFRGMREVTEDLRHPFDDPKAFVEKFLQEALEIMAKHGPDKYRKTGDAWLSALREAFGGKYELFRGRPDKPRIAVFGGKPPKDAPDSRNPHGFHQWHRWEFMHDVSVIELKWIESAYHEILVPVVKRVLWQVESEVSTNGTQVAEDLSKLIAGVADYKLLIVARTTQPDPVPWAQFHERAAEGITGTAFVAEIPTYARKDIRDWCQDAKSKIEVRELGVRGSAARSRNPESTQGQQPWTMR